MDDKAAIAEIDAALNPSTEIPATDAPATDQVVDDKFVEYFLGNKANKLPLDAVIALKEKGQIQKIPLSQVVNGFRMNAQSARKFEEANKVKGEFEKTKGEYQKLQENYKAVERYKALQDWSEQLEMKDPVGYKLLMDTIERVKTGAYSAPEGGGDISQTSALHQTIADLRGKIEELSGWKSQFETANEQKKMEDDRKFVDNEITEIKTKFKEINLDELDEMGIRLSTKVENWGVEKGYQNFTDAFYGYFRDKIAEILMQRGKNEAVGGIKRDNAKGIIARSSIPFNGHPTEAKNSYDEFKGDAVKILEAALNQ